MNKWLYHAAGTAGIVGGVLLLGTGGAQADERDENFDALLGEVFSPTSGLPPLDLPLTGSPLAGTPLAGTPLGGSPLAGSPLDTAGLSDLALGSGLPVPAHLVQLDRDPLGLPSPFANTGFRTLPAPAPAPVSEAGPAEIVGPMPLLTDSLTKSLLGGRSLGDLVALGDPTRQVPVAGPIVSQTTHNTPLVSDIVAGPRSRTMPVSPQSTPLDAADPLALAGPIGGDQLPPLIAQQLADEGGYSPELLDGTDPELLGGGGLPLLGPSLDPVTQMVGVGDLPRQVPLVGPLAAPVLDGLPMVGRPAPAGPAADVNERPVVGEDPEYTESLI